MCRELKSLEAPAVAPAAAPGALKRQMSTSRRASFSAEGEEIVKAGCFTRNVMRCPCLVMWGTFVAALVLSAIPIVTGAVTVSSVAAAGFDSASIAETEHWHAWQRVQDSKYEAGGKQHVSESKDGEDLPVLTYFEGLNADSNMFTADAIGAMATYETALLEVEGWCARSLCAAARPHPPAMSPGSECTYGRPQVHTLQEVNATRPSHHARRHDPVKVLGTLHRSAISVPKRCTGADAMRGGVLRRTGVWHAAGAL